MLGPQSIVHSISFISCDLGHARIISFHLYHKTGGSLRGRNSTRWSVIIRCEYHYRSVSKLLTFSPLMFSKTHSNKWASLHTMRYSVEDYRYHQQQPPVYFYVIFILHFDRRCLIMILGIYSCSSIDHSIIHIPDDLLLSQLSSAVVLPMRMLLLQH